MSNGLDPDQDQHYVSPDLDPNCLQRLSADHKIMASKERVCLFDLILYVPVNNLSVMSGQIFLN